MPKTRNDMFKTAITEFMKTSESIHDRDLKWSIVLLTNNTTRNIHDYTIKIPLQVVDYVVDTTYEVDGEWNDPGPVYRTQTIPNFDDFIKEFDAYFEPFAIYITNMKLSFVDLSSIFRNTTEIVLSIRVFYHKKHLPYPVTRTPIEDFQQRCSELTAINERLTTVNDDLYEDNNQKLFEINRIRRILKKTREHYAITFNRMGSKIRDYYGKTNVLEDCPVCYESISSDQLEVTKCLHYICKGCASKCTACPLCRDVY